MTSDSPPTDIDRILQVLFVEYAALNAKMTTRTSARYQFLGFITAGAAILATGTGSSFSGQRTWILVGLAIATFIFGLASFWLLGRAITRMSDRVADIEGQINSLIPGEYLSYHLAGQQQRGLWTFILGYGSISDMRLGLRRQKARSSKSSRLTG